MVKLLALACATFGTLAATSATASLVGDTVRAQFSVGPGGTYTNAVDILVPGSSTPFPGIGSSGVFGITLTDTRITLLSSGGVTSFIGGYNFNGPIFTVINGPTNIGNVTLDSLTTLAGFTAANIAFTSNSISLNLSGLVFKSDDRLVIDVGDAAAVPELASWAMIIMGFGLVGATMRRRKVAVNFA